LAPFGDRRVLAKVEYIIIIYRIKKLKKRNKNKI